MSIEVRTAENGSCFMDLRGDQIAAALEMVARYCEQTGERQVLLIPIGDIPNEFVEGLALLVNDHINGRSEGFIVGRPQP